MNRAVSVGTQQRATRKCLRRGAVSIAMWLCAAAVATAQQPEPATHVKSAASPGQPLGVAAVHIQFAEHQRPPYQPDQTILVSSPDRQTLYPAVQIQFDEPAAADSEQAPHDRRLNNLHVYFLFAGPQTPTVSVALDSQILAENIQLPTAMENERGELLNEWWQAYQQQPTLLTFSEQEAYVHNYLCGMLARRLQLPDPRPLDSSGEQSQVEKYFEKAAMMMFGFASVNSAIGETNWSTYKPDRYISASEPLPNRIEIPSVQVPDTKDVPIETIAKHVPADCLYVRCRTVENYFWFRHFLMDWGGGLNEIVAARTQDSAAREKIERQLALIPDEHGQQVLRQNLQDLALIAADPFFEDGAAIGILLEARNPGPIRDWIADCRQRVAQETHASQSRVDINGRNVMLLSTPDRRVRSFLAVDGQYILVTNSAKLAEQFLSLPSRSSSLGNTAEFRYARSQFSVDADQTVFIYLSDPFFRRLASPELRVELSRRKRSAHELRYLALAQLAARAEGAKANSVDELIAGGYLPDRFGQRADQSRPVLVRGEPQDSARGVPGTFTPIIDMEVRRATPGEIGEFYDFRQQYLREWRATDPVVVFISHEPQDQREQVHVQIAITPYARERYQALTQHLDAPGNHRVVPPATDLLSLSARVHRREQGTFTLHAGVEDAEIPFTLRDGQLAASLPEGKESYATAYTYFAYRDGSVRDLLVVRDMLQQLGLDADTGNASAFMAVVDVMFTFNTLRPGNLLRKVLPFGGNIIPDVPTDPLDVVTQNWRVISRTAGVGSEARDQLKLVSSSTPSQMWLAMREIAGTKVEPYLQAYCYLQARKDSARNARLMNTLMQQFHVRAENVPPAIEKVFSSQPACPLGGDFQPRGDSAAHNYFVSTMWGERSLHTETNVPEDYRFPFLNWLRGLDLNFRLEPTTLHADVDLLVQPQHASGAAKPK